MEMTKYLFLTILVMVSIPVPSALSSPRGLMVELEGIWNHES